MIKVQYDKFTAKTPTLFFFPEVSTWHPYSTETIMFWWHQRIRFLLWRLKTATQALSCRTFSGLLRYRQDSERTKYILIRIQFFKNVWIVSVQQVSYLWEEISWLQQCLSPSQSSCSCTLQTRLKMLQAVSHLQVVQWLNILVNMILWKKMNAKFLSSFIIF